MKTTDVCDNFPNHVHIAEPLGWQYFGKKQIFNGIIQTVKCFEDNSFVRATLEQDGTNKVLVVDGGGSKQCALLGDMLAELAIKHHWDGVVVFGCVRDVAEIDQLEIGVVALDTHPRKSNKANVGEQNVVVHFAGIDFVPNQRVFVDRDGIVTLNEQA